jgi:hypothetical protein
MFGLWHWKHFDTSTSFPGPSGKPTAAGFFCCANADWNTSAPPSRTAQGLSIAYM